MPVNIYIDLKGSTSSSSDSYLGASDSDNRTINPITLEQPQVMTPTQKVSTAKIAAISAATMVGKQAVSYISSNVGKWTGNSHNQTIVNNVMEVAGLGIVAAQSPFMAVAIAGVKIGTTALETYQEQYRDSLRSRRDYLKAGYRNYEELKGNKR